MQADMEDRVQMKLEGKMAKLLVSIDPKLYREYMHIKNGQEILYIELRKAFMGH